MILFEKYGKPEPLDWLSERYAREGGDLSAGLCARRQALHQPPS